jgi:mannan endo-1,4-beta-mannosidase
MRFRPESSAHHKSAAPGPDGKAATVGATAPAAASHVGFHLPRTHGATGVVIALALAAVATTVYLSPASGSQRTASPPGTPTPTGSSAAASGLPVLVPDGSTPVASPDPTPTATRHTTAPPRSSRPSFVPVYNTVQGPTIIQREIVYNPAKAAKALHCTDFRWQQDAQTAYAANLTDPWGLDGAPGPHNGDGLACTQLPVDPSRSASTPLDAYVPPSPAQKSALMAPAQRYFGVAEDGLPGDSGLYNQIAQQAGKAPSEVSWFATWDETFNSDKVVSAWSHGALPMVTWMTVSGDVNSTTAGTYTLANIVSGKFDNYLLSYAGSVLRTGLPVVIRFDHEMNGNWFPWSAGMAANQGASGQPNLYVQAWRHIWTVFDSVGANADVIWLWSPVRVDNINPHSSLAGFKYETTLAEDYPGDAYVDWVGMSAYQYKPSDGWSYETTFRKTLDALEALCHKPIFVSETGATETVGTVDYAQQKAQWTTLTLAGLASEPGVIGFSWFNNPVQDVHKVDGTPIRTDWQFSSSPAALAAFRSGIANRAYGSGIMPDVSGKK